MDSVSEQMNKLLREYGDDIKEVVKDSLDIVSDEAVKELARTSPPIQPSKRHKYKKGWTFEKWKNSRLYEGVTLYNKSQPQLTHLLEFGHVKRGGAGRVRAFPHIEPAEEYAGDMLMKDIMEGVEKIK